MNFGNQDCARRCVLYASQPVCPLFRNASLWWLQRPRQAQGLLLFLWRFFQSIIDESHAWYNPGDLDSLFNVLAWSVSSTFSPISLSFPPQTGPVRGFVVPYPRTPISFDRWGGAMGLSLAIQWYYFKKHPQRVDVAKSATTHSMSYARTPVHDE